MLVAAGEDLWTVEGPTVSFYGFAYPTRMAVARLPGRHLWLWSPIELDAALGEALAGLGDVSYLVAPNKLHHLFLGPWVERYPKALLFAAPGLEEKRRDLAFTAELGNTPRPEWQGIIDQVVLGGSFVLNELVFYHRPSSTALVCDSIQKHDPSRFSGWRRWLMKADGLMGPDGSTPREWRATFTDRKTARAALGKILAWDPKRLILAHGPVFEHDGRDVIASSLSWIG